MICSALSGSIPSMWRKRSDTGSPEKRSGAAGAPLSRRRWTSGHAFDEHDAFFLVHFVQAHFDDFGVAGLHVPAHIAGLDGQLAVSAVFGAPRMRSSSPRSPWMAVRCM